MAYITPDTPIRPMLPGYAPQAAQQPMQPIAPSLGDMARNLFGYQHYMNDATVGAAIPPASAAPAPFIPVPAPAVAPQGGSGAWADLFQSPQGTETAAPTPAPAQQEQPYRDDHPAQAFSPPDTTWTPHGLTAMTDPNNIRNILARAALLRSAGINPAVADIQRQLEGEAAHTVFDGPEFHQRVMELMHSHNLDQLTAEAAARHEAYNANPALQQTYQDLFAAHDAALLHDRAQRAIADGNLTGNYRNYNALAGTGILEGFDSNLPTGIGVRGDGTLDMWGMDGTNQHVQPSDASAFFNPVTPEERHELALRNFGTMFAANSRDQQMQARLQEMETRDALRAATAGTGGQRGGSGTGGDPAAAIVNADMAQHPSAAWARMILQTVPATDTAPEAIAIRKSAIDTLAAMKASIADGVQAGGN